MSTSTSQRPLERGRTATPPAVPAPRGNRRAWTSRGHLTAAALLTLAFVSPVYLTLVNAFKTQDQIVRDPAAPPAPPTTHNLTDALARPDRIVQIGLTNSAATVVVSVLLIIPLGAALSFWLSRRSARLRRIVLAGFAA
ncbi:carbohydrate ABC transporter permease, partial [Streptomyces sp. NPDC005538]